MATAAQLNANQANAQHSTGPRSVEGKTRVSQNALRHGLTAARFVVPDSEREEFAIFRDALLAEIDPQGAVETVTFQELLHAAWNLHRFRSIEVQCCSGTLADFSDPQCIAVLDRLGRYQARAQRAYYRALHELRTLQTNRALRAAKLEEEVEPDVPAIVDINELTKQTHSEVTAEAIKQACAIVECQTGLLNLDAIHRASNSRLAAAAAAARAASAQPGPGAESSGRQG